MDQDDMMEDGRLMITEKRSAFPINIIIIDGYCSFHFSFLL